MPDAKGIRGGRAFVELSALRQARAKPTTASSCADCAGPVAAGGLFRFLAWGGREVAPRFVGPDRPADGQIGTMALLAAGWAAAQAVLIRAGTANAVGRGQRQQSDIGE